jgi:flagellin
MGGVATATSGRQTSGPASKNGEIPVSFSVNTNNNALAALQTLNLTQQALTKTQNRVSSGLKVAGAADDASTFAIAQGQRGDIAGFQQVSNSLAIGSATVAVALQGATSISDTLNQLKAKIIQGLSSSAGSLPSIQNDVNSLIAQIDSTGAAAQFNGVNLIQSATSATTDDVVLSSLNRSGSTLTTANITVASQDLHASALGVNGINISDAGAQLTLGATFSVATGNTVALTTAAGTTTFEFVATAATSLTASTNVAVVIGATTGTTVSNLNAALATKGFNSTFDAQGNLNISSGAGPITAKTITGAVGLTGGVGTAQTSGVLALVETAINKVQAALSSLGTAANKLSTQSNFIKNLTDTLTTGVGQLVDADLAAESANLQALQTKQQLGIQALSIANQGPGAVLTLFR